MRCRYYGSGIALAAAQNNYPVVLFHNNEKVLENAKTAINKNLEFLVEKQKISATGKDGLINKNNFTSTINE